MPWWRSAVYISTGLITSEFSAALGNKAYGNARSRLGGKEIGDCRKR